MLKLENKFSAFIIAAVTSFYSTGIAAQSKVTIAFQIPLEHHLAQNILFFKEELETMSNATISVQINDYESYLKDRKDLKKLDSEQQYFMAKDMLEAIQSRKIDIGLISLARVSKLIPLADIFNQPFLIDNETKLSDMVSKDSFVRRSIEGSLQELGLKTLWWQPYGSVIFVSKGSSIKTPEQMKDKKVRVFGKTLGNLVLAAGGTPLAIPNSLQYFAYKHQKVDIGMTTIADVRKKKIWEVMDTISLTNNANMQFLLVTNNRWWNSLTTNTRRLISQAASSAEEKSVKMLKSIEVASFNEAIQNGMRIVVLSNDDRDYWREKSGPIYENFLENTGSNGQVAFDATSTD